jgi:hypothetical protein
MQKRYAPTALAVVALTLGLSVPAAAQSADTAVRERPERGTTGIDVDRLPLDLNRIRRELNQAPAASETRDGLKLRYFLQIFGTAPELKIFTDDIDLVSGPVPYGAPTHGEILRVITPKEFSVPVFSVPIPMKKKR